MKCPHCLDGTVENGTCTHCGREIRTISGVPSVSDRDDADPKDDQLERLAERVEPGPLDEVHRLFRTGAIDESVVDRFFKTRASAWRVLVSPPLSGRCLLLGDHDESVGMVLAETLEEVWVADTNLSSLRALASVATTRGATDLEPVHAAVGELPFPPDAFDTVVVDCPAKESRRYLEAALEHLAPTGRIVLLCDGWTRELGVAKRFEMGDPADGTPRERIRNAVSSLPFSMRRTCDRLGLETERRYALLSSHKHENVIGFNGRSEPAVEWLLNESQHLSISGTVMAARQLARLTRRTRILEHCYPRYLFVFRPGGSRLNPEDTVLISGKNRSTLMELDGGSVVRLRKVPNSLWQGTRNENAQRVIDRVTETEGIASTVPDRDARTTAYGLERLEMPVRGVPLNQLMRPNPECFGRYLGISFDWLTRLHTQFQDGRVEKTPDAVADDLRDERFGLDSPPRPTRSVAYPQTAVHGDFWGSNVYVANGRVSDVIDWEWASLEANPIVDSGFFPLEAAEYIGPDFERGFERLFLEDTRYSAILYDRILEYCEYIGITPRTFATYLPMGYIERARKDVSFNGRLDVDWPARVEHVWANHAEIARRLDGKQVTNSSW